MQLDKPDECASGGNPLLLYKILHSLFFPPVWILCALHLESRKILSTWSWCGTFGISVSSAEGMSHQPVQNSLCFGIIGKTPGLFSSNNFVKKMFVSIGHCDNVLARSDSIFPSFNCRGVWNKTFAQLSLSQILFQNLKNYSLGDVQRFCYHSWCNSTVIFDQNSSNVYLSLSPFWTATSLVMFSQLPSVSKSRIPPKNFWSVQSLIPISLCTNTDVSATDRPALRQSFIATLCSFLPSAMY